MSKNLVIVESPAKAKTIGKFLGKDFKVSSSYGHIRDLNKKGIGIDFEHGYKPLYEVPEEKQKLVAELKKEAGKCDTVWLASDEDREGEAIAWHLAEVLKLDPMRTKRIVFHEITKNAILNAIEHPRDIDLNLVDAQQARRVLDRIVGFELSPILWKKIKPSLSAGRVQSVAVRLIVEREREIRDFKSESSYRAVAVFESSGGERFEAEYEKRFATKQEALEFLEKCSKATFEISNVSVKPAKRSPAPPFTTSTLQQEAARKLSFPVALTMMIAQRLYEDGKITYMRTDSVNLSSLAINTSKAEIESFAGAQYSKPRNFTTKTKGAQEAHEAIRPTYMNVHSLEEGSKQDKALYELIWKRTIASQMADAKIERTEFRISSPALENDFKAEGEVLLFDGFLKVYRESRDDESENEDHKMLPKLPVGEILSSGSVVCTERFSQRPPRYTEASLVHKLEELGIGRPSTYASTISTILNRGYVEKADRDGELRKYGEIRLQDGKITESELSETVGRERAKLIPTDIGVIVNDYLVSHFEDIMNYNFTAKVEQELDNVADGKKNWEKAIDAFYKQFHPLIENVANARSEHKVGERSLGSDPVSGKEVFVKIGRFGPVVQMGSTSDEEKPRFAPLPKGVSMENITLQQAMEQFKLPKSLGEFEGSEVKANNGRFGPYVQHAGKFYSLPKGTDPLDVDLSEAIAVIEAKRDSDKEKVFKTFPEDASVQLLNGRYGIYLCKDGTNYKLPKDCNPGELTFADCMKIISEAPEKTAKKGRWKRKQA